jgi:hypothetical protein
MKAALVTVCAVAALAAGNARAAAQVTEAQLFANALAVAVPASWSVPSRYSFTDFSCRPVRGVTVWMERVFVCHGWETIHRNGKTFYGATYVLADGSHVEASEVGQPLDAPAFHA